jgi:hypothetical protein
VSESSDPRVHLAIRLVETVNLLASSQDSDSSDETQTLFQILGDQYIVGQAAVVGPSGIASHTTLNQLWVDLADTTDLDTLREELARLRPALRHKASTPEHDVAVAEVALAEMAASDGDGAGVLAHLKKAGRWSFDVATDVGVALTAELMKRAAGF